MFLLERDGRIDSYVLKFIRDLGIVNLYRAVNYPTSLVDIIEYRKDHDVNLQTPYISHYFPVEVSTSEEMSIWISSLNEYNTVNKKFYFPADEDIADLIIRNKEGTPLVYIIGNAFVYTFGRSIIGMLYTTGADIREDTYHFITRFLYTRELLDHIIKLNCSSSEKPIIEGFTKQEYENLRSYEASTRRILSDLKHSIKRQKQTEDKIKELESGGYLDTLKKDISVFMPHKIDKYYFVKEKLMLVTVPMSIEGYENTPCRYLISIDINKFIRGVDVEGAIRIYNIDPEYTNRFPHPHVATDGVLCYGNMLDSMQKSFQNGDLGTLIGLLLMFLNSYSNTAGYRPYEKIHKWAPNLIDFESCHETTTPDKCNECEHKEMCVYFPLTFKNCYTQNLTHFMGLYKCNTCELEHCPYKNLNQFKQNSWSSQRPFCVVKEFDLDSEPCNQCPIKNCEESIGEINERI